VEARQHSWEEQSAKISKRYVSSVKIILAIYSPWIGTASKALKKEGKSQRMGSWWGGTVTSLMQNWSKILVPLSSI
jgi:hypothetical protein